MMMDQSLHDPCTSFDLMWNSEIEVTEGRTRNICRDLSALNGSEITEGILRDAGVIRSYMGHDLATNAYALLCEDSPFRCCEVRCGAFGGKYETDFLDRADYSCPIYRQIDYVYAFLRRNLRVLDELMGSAYTRSLLRLSVRPSSTRFSTGIMQIATGRYSSRSARIVWRYDRLGECRRRTVWISIRGVPMCVILRYRRCSEWHLSAEV